MPYMETINFGKEKCVLVGSWIFKEATNHNGLDTLAGLSLKEGVVSIGISSWSSVYKWDNLVPKRGKQLRVSVFFLISVRIIVGTVHYLLKR